MSGVKNKVRRNLSVSTKSEVTIFENRETWGTDRTSSLGKLLVNPQDVMVKIVGIVKDQPHSRILKFNAEIGVNQVKDVINKKYPEFCCDKYRLYWEKGGIYVLENSVLSRYTSGQETVTFLLRKPKRPNNVLIVAHIDNSKELVDVWSDTKILGVIRSLNHRSIQVFQDWTIVNSKGVELPLDMVLFFHHKLKLVYCRPIDQLNLEVNTVVSRIARGSPRDKRARRGSITSSTKTDNSPSRSDDEIGMKFGDSLQVFDDNYKKKVNVDPFKFAVKKPDKRLSENIFINSADCNISGSGSTEQSADSDPLSRNGKSNFEDSGEAEPAVRTVIVSKRTSYPLNDTTNGVQRHASVPEEMERSSSPEKLLQKKNARVFKFADLKNRLLSDAILTPKPPDKMSSSPSEIVPYLLKNPNDSPQISPERANLKCSAENEGDFDESFLQYKGKSRSSSSIHNPLPKPPSLNRKSSSSVLKSPKTENVDVPNEEQPVTFRQILHKSNDSEEPSKKFSHTNTNLPAPVKRKSKKKRPLTTTYSCNTKYPVKEDELWRNSRSSGPVHACKTLSKSYKYKESGRIFKIKG
jgi:hypothetical protein